MKHIVTKEHLNPDVITSIFYFTRLCAQNHSWPYPNKILGTIFFEPSTRTRWSFEAAMLKLNGKVISTEMAKDSSSDKKGESFQDTLKTCSQYADILAVRHSEDNIITDNYKYSEVPVINCGEGKGSHPTQGLLDYFTIKEKFNNLEGKTILFTGDIFYSRTIQSLLDILDIMNEKMNLVFYDDTNASAMNIIGFNVDNPNFNLKFTQDVKEYLPKADILYMTRHQKEKNGFNRDISDFILHQENINFLKDEAIIMHPLPRNSEISNLIDNDPRAYYFKQVKNGLHVRMGILEYIMS